MNNLDDFLKSNSKDEASFKILSDYFSRLSEENKRIKNHLDLLERAICSDYDSILITTIDLEKPGPVIVYVNDGFTRMTGYSREEVLGKTPRILQGPKTDRAVLDKLREQLSEGQSFFGHTVNYRKDGSEFINQWDIHPLTNENNEITHWVSYQHDVTERKRSELKVTDPGIEFDKLTEESKKTMSDLDEQGNILSANKSFRDLVGYDEDELKEKKFWQLLTDKYIENFRHKFDSFKPGDFDERTYDFELKHKKGSGIEVRAKTHLLHVNGQMIVRISFENKSLQKRIKALLSQRNERFRKVFDNSKDFTYKISTDKTGEFYFVSLSDSFAKITGIPVEEARNRPVKEFVHEEDYPKIKKHLAAVLKGKPNTEQFRLKKSSGKFSEVIDYAKPVRDISHSETQIIKGIVSVEISSVRSS